MRVRTPNNAYSVALNELSSSAPSTWPLTRIDNRSRHFYAELPVEQRPREPQRALERKRPVGEPHVELKAGRSGSLGR